jgi:hypothetical protein
LYDPLRTSSAEMPEYFPRFRLAFSLASAMRSSSLNKDTKVALFCRTLIPWSRPLESLNLKVSRYSMDRTFCLSSFTQLSWPCATRYSMTFRAL